MEVERIAGIADMVLRYSGVDHLNMVLSLSSKLLSELQNSPGV